VDAGDIAAWLTWVDRVLLQTGFAPYLPIDSKHCIASFTSAFSPESPSLQQHRWTRHPRPNPRSECALRDDRYTASTFTLLVRIEKVVDVHSGGLSDEPLSGNH
jgi:hypothetical protein